MLEKNEHSGEKCTYFNNYIELEFSARTHIPYVHLS